MALSLRNSAMVRRDPVWAEMKRSSQWLQTQRCICGHYTAVAQSFYCLFVAMFLCNGEKPVCPSGNETCLPKRTLPYRVSVENY